MATEPVPFIVVDRDVEPSTKDKVVSLEERYIKLLEEKIERLEREALQTPATTSSSESSASAEPLSDNKGEGKDKKEKKKKGDDGDDDNDSDKDEEDDRETAKVRYVERKHTLFDYNDTFKKRSEWDRNSDDNDTAANAPVITWRRTQYSDDKTVRQLLIESTALRTALKAILDESVEITFDTHEVAIRAPYTILYHSEEKIRKYAEDPANAAVKPDIDILLDEIEQEQKAARKDIVAYKKNGIITFEFLWALFYPGCRVIITVMEEPQMFVVAEQLPQSPYEDEENFQMFVFAIDWDGNEFQPVGRLVVIKKFAATKGIMELEVCPVEYWKDSKGETQTPEDLEARLEERGRLYEGLCTAKLEKRHRRYHGMAITAGAIEMAKDDDKDDGTVASDARTDEKAGEQIQIEERSFVMIDHHAYLTMFKIGPTQLRIGKEEAEWLNQPHWRHWHRRSKGLIGDLPEKAEGEKRRRLSPEQLQLCPPRVLGFAVSKKEFVQLLVKNFEDGVDKDKEQPFQDLELAKKTKDTLKKLVIEHAKDSIIEDLIPGKGQGLVVLLHGPPGVGKTLTAESLAILTDKPLYSVSMADVGTSPRTVEINLRRIFQLATHWKALLLFDEADVFLEARSLQDVRRNSLVSTLLRILEYFQGILFLTSNRVKTFDEAFQSRIHFAIQFHVLNEKQRRRIWEMWFKKARDRDQVDPDFEWEEYLEEEGKLINNKLNGRQIRNVFRSALNLAKADKKLLNWEHVDEILHRTTNFQNYMLQSEEVARKDNLR